MLPREYYYLYNALNRSRPLSSKPFPIFVRTYITYATGYLDIQIKEEEASEAHNTDRRDENAYTVLARKSEGKITLGRNRIGECGLESCNSE